MTISQIYDRFGTPPNLREHMIHVTQLVLLIANNWKGEGAIDQGVLLKAGLLHDLANIVKFTSPETPELKAKQQEIITKYGSDDHIATQKMLHEIGLDNYIIDLIQNKSLSNAINIVDSSDWNLKILFYSDMRISPNGITSLDDRISELISRSEKYRMHPKLSKLISSAKTIEAQIQSQTKIDLSRILPTQLPSSDFINVELI